MTRQKGLPPVQMIASAPLSTGLLIMLGCVAVAARWISGGSAAMVAAVLGLWCPHVSAYLLATAGVLAIGVPLERRIGTARTAIAFLVSQLVGSALADAATTATHAESVNAGGSTVAGPWLGLLGVVLASSAFLIPRWRRRGRAALLGILITLVIYLAQPGAVAALGAALAGVLIGWIFGRADRVRHGLFPAPPQQRGQLALLQVCAALGPLLVTAGRGFTPWMRPRSPIACADLVDPQSCVILEAQSRLDALGAAAMFVVPTLLLLVLAEGLRRGRRFAWQAAVGVNAVLAVLAGARWDVASEANTKGSLSPAAAILFTALPWAVPAAVPAVMAILVFRARAQFTASAPTAGARRLIGATGVAAVLAGIYVVMGWLSHGLFDQSPVTGSLLAGTPGRSLLAPPGPSAQLPHGTNGTLATILYQGVGAAFWIITFLVAVIGLLHLDGPADAGAARQARSLLERHGGSSLSYLTTWRGHRYWFSSDRASVVAYRVVTGVAVTTGGPIGPMWARQAAAAAFAEFSRANGWIPVSFSVDAAGAVDLTALGWKTLRIAEDNLLDLEQLTFTGRRWQDIRTALNRAEREDVTNLWLRYPTADPAVTEQINALSLEWIAEQELPEMGFTLGGIGELDDPAVRCLIALDRDANVLAITSWLPIYGAGRTVQGWTLDLLRRRRDAMPGVMEYLIATAATDLKREGAKVLSLSGAPLARSAKRGDTEPMMDRLLSNVSRRLEPMYGFQSLFAFKSKFKPINQPLYLAYPEGAALPAAAYAVSRGYVPHLTGRQLLTLIRRLIAAPTGSGRPANPGSGRSKHDHADASVAGVKGGGHG